MSSEKDYQRLAANMRASAELITDPYEKRTLLLIAQRYDVMADRARRTAEAAPLDKSA